MDCGLRIANCGAAKTKSHDGSVCAEGFRVFRNRFAFTLVEMLVVMALIAALAGTLAVAAVYARRLSVRVECQSNMHEIGTTLNSLMLTEGGQFPELGWSDDNSTIPWWARVYAEWQGSGGSRIDTDPSTDGLQLPDQLPGAMKSFHCRMGGALRHPVDDPPPATPEEQMASRVKNLFNSISYGLHFDTKLDTASSDTPGTPYECVPDTNELTGATGSPSADDKKPDILYATEIKDPSRFILLSEAHTQDPDPANWTGGRITMSAITRDGSDVPPGNAPIPGRHGGSANVLFADMSMDVLRVSGEHWTKDVNLNTALWTLPAD